MRLYLSSFRLGNAREALMELVGTGRRASVIANADDHKTGADREASYERERVDLEGLDFEVDELDLRSYFGLPPESLLERLSEVELLWVRGGNPFILRRALRQSGADALIADMIATDSFVYGGYSAGAVMMTPSLHGIEYVDDPALVPVGYESPVIWEGLGILAYSILPHFRSAHPESPAIEDVMTYLIDHHLPFVAIRDGQAIVVGASGTRVVGDAAT